MKFSIPILLSLLTSVALGMPTVKDDEGDPLPETSRVTAFVVDENGIPSVECWEFDNMVSNMKTLRKDGSVGTARSMKIADVGGLEGLDILTWPSYAAIWPDPHVNLDDEVEADWLDLSNTFNLFNVQGGLINFKFSIFAAENANDWPDHVFSMQNGDDWFYFEDNYTGTSRQLRVDSAPPPVQVSSISGTETEVLRIRYPQRPAYKVLHKGGCSFSGISTPLESRLGQSSRVHNRLTKQHYGNTGL